MVSGPAFTVEGLSDQAVFARLGTKTVLHHDRELITDRECRVT